MRWFRALPAGLPAGGYFVLRNAGTDTRRTDRRVFARLRHASCCTRVEMGGMDHMEMVDSGPCRPQARSSSSPAAIT